jgi:hypothetical protein
MVYLAFGRRKLIQPHPGSWNLCGHPSSASSPTFPHYLIHHHYIIHTLRYNATQMENNRTILPAFFHRILAAPLMKTGYGLGDAEDKISEDIVCRVGYATLL